MHTKALGRRNVAVVILVMVTALAAEFQLKGNRDSAEWRSVSQFALRNPAGGPQLVSVEPLPAMEGEMCQWLTAGANTTLVAALRQEPWAAYPEAASSRDAVNAVDADRAPVRVIRDTYPTYSAVAVDLNTNEVFLQDENLFGINVFNRLDDTQPGASFTEPKRRLRGMNTKMDFNCGLYIDPESGDVYSVSNDTVDTLVVFPREAHGNVAPMRELKTTHGTFGIAVDEGAEEMFLTVQHSNSVVIYRKMAEGEEKPIRILEGNRTQLEDPHGIAVDTKNNWLFVSNHGSVVGSGRAPGSGRFELPSITVYPLKASGDTAPLRIIEGPKAQLNWPAALTMDSERGELYVANDAGDSVLVFRTTDQGDVAPTRVIHGPKTGIKNPTGLFLDLKNDELWVSNMGNHRTTVYPRTANGDMAPLRTIRSAPEGKLALTIGNPGAVAYDSKREEILVPN